MKKIGILFGQENTFPQAFVDRVNSKKENGITAELAHINKIIQGEPLGYDVLIDQNFSGCSILSCNVKECRN